MQSPRGSNLPKFSQEEETNSPDIIKSNEEAEARSGKDNLSANPTNSKDNLPHGSNTKQEDPDLIGGSAGPEEKDITD